MKFLIYTVAFLLIGFTGCQTTNEIYIVRHAEKGTEPANDPPLTVEGKARAEVLKDLLKDKKIKAIFSTQRVRTTETVTPLGRLLNVPIQPYGNDTLAAFLQRVIGLKNNAVIAAHSNTSVSLLTTLNLPHTVTFIPEDDYDNLFIIKVKNGKAVKITETTYGATSPAVK